MGWLDCWSLSSFGSTSWWSGHPPPRMNSTEAGIERRDDDFTMIADVGCMRAAFLRFIGISTELEIYAINVSAGAEEEFGRVIGEMHEDQLRVFWVRPHLRGESWKK